MIGNVTFDASRVNLHTHVALWGLCRGGLVGRSCRFFVVGCRGSPYMAGRFLHEGGMAVQGFLHGGGLHGGFLHGESCMAGGDGVIVPR